MGCGGSKQEDVYAPIGGGFTPNNTKSTAVKADGTSNASAAIGKEIFQMVVDGLSDHVNSKLRG